VLRAGEVGSEAGTQALEQLCRTYWFPLYAYVRRVGHAPEDARDLTQEFFAQLIARRDLAQVSPTRGRFRSFLLACLNHFLAKDWRARRTLKRGGGATFLPLDVALAEEHLDSAAATHLTPEQLYDQRWAITIMTQALEDLRREMAEPAKARVFEELRGFLTDAAADGVYESLAERLGMSPAAVATAVHRLRRRYRELVRKALAQSVTTQLELEEEMRHLLDVLTRCGEWSAGNPVGQPGL
jgi:RNA polymerase sigma factor (sigma-70 family)